MLNINKRVLASILSLNIMLLNGPVINTAQAKAVTNDSFFDYQENSLWVGDVINLICSFPESLLNDFREHGVNILLVDHDGWLEKKFKNKAIKGITFYDSGDIYVESFVRKGLKDNVIKNGCPEELVKDMDDYELSFLEVRDVVVHELGHFIDSMNGFPSDSKQFKKLHKNELSGYLKTRHNKIENRNISANYKKTSEFFATAFSCYYLYPEELYKYCPDTYTFMDNLFQTYVIRDQNKKVK